MSCIPSAAYRIILARCTTRNGIVTMLARRSSSARSSPESSITYWLTRGTTHHFAAPRSIPPDSPQDLRTRLLVEWADGEPVRLELRRALADLADNVQDSAATNLLAFIALQ